MIHGLWQNLGDGRIELTADSLAAIAGAPVPMRPTLQSKIPEGSLDKWEKDLGSR